MIPLKVYILKMFEIYESVDLAFVSLSKWIYKNSIKNDDKTEARSKAISFSIKNASIEESHNDIKPNSEFPVKFNKAVKHFINNVEYYQTYSFDANGIMYTFCVYNKKLHLTVTYLEKPFNWGKESYDEFLRCFKLASIFIDSVSQDIKLESITYNCIQGLILKNSEEELQFIGNKIDQFLL